MSRIRNVADDIILDRAMSVFWRHGYAATTMRDLTRATGLSTAALYHRFIDKDGLFVEVLRHYGDQGPSARVACLSALSSPLDAIRRFFDELVAISVEDPQQRGCLLVNTALDGAAMSAAARELVRARLGEVKAFFGAQLQLRGLLRGHRRGDRYRYGRRVHCSALSWQFAYSPGSIQIQPDCACSSSTVSPSFLQQLTGSYHDRPLLLGH